VRVSCYEGELSSNQGERKAHCNDVLVLLQGSTMIVKTQQCVKGVAVDTRWLGSTPTILGETFRIGFSIAAVHRSCFFSGHRGVLEVDKIREL
jgi:hypothetical protein